ncbi:hypothetical protein ACWDKQ_00675 [Saccharopolyspora sp. NPDC000995]
MRVCRQQCFKKNWVVDFDVKAFLDSVSWDLILKAVARHTTRRWVMLYVERWLKAPMQMPDGTLVYRHLMRWARRKNKRLVRSEARTRGRLKGALQRSPNLFALGAALHDLTTERAG